MDLKPGSVFRNAGQRESVLSGVLSWLVANIEFFDPPQEDSLLEECPERIAAGAMRKAFGELGLALRIAQRVPALRQKEEVRLLRDAWLERVRTRRLFFDIRRRLHIFPLCAVALAVLDGLGASDEEARRLLQNALDRGYMDRVERSAWAKLDIKYYLEAARLRHGLPDDATLLAESSLVRLPALPYARNSDFYALTHLIFHFSDFGSQSMRRLMGAHFEGVREYTCLALQICSYERDFDLTAELLIGLICLEHRSDPLNWEASDALCRSQQPGGFIPDRKWLAGLEPAESTEAAKRNEFLAVYHPTLVTLILAACDVVPPAGAAGGIV